MASTQLAHLLSGLLSDNRLRTASGKPYISAVTGPSTDYDQNMAVQPTSKAPGSSAAHLSTSPLTSPLTSHQEVNLCFGISALDNFFSGGLAFGTLLEMGIPFGNGGRRLLALFMATATSGLSGGQKHWCLWISARPHLKAYPPAWQALGVDLRRLRFASSESPVSELKAAFLDDFFRVIIIDHPSPLEPDEYVFLAQCARQHRKIIVVARDGFLSPRDSNTAARYRLNVWRPPRKNILEITPVRGLHRSLKLSSFFQHPDIKIAT